MSAHTDSRQCLANLSQVLTDGGGKEYRQQQRTLLGVEPEEPTGDCAVAAVVHATFLPCTGASYKKALDGLSASILPWMHKERRKGEGRFAYWIRQLRGSNYNPIHGTITHATSFYLEAFSYEPIYPNRRNLWHCICDMVCVYVLDVQCPNDHTMTVHRGVVYTTKSFELDETEVFNVRRLDAKRTKELKARRQYEEDDRQWRQRWLERSARDYRLIDWESCPKLEDYLRG